MNTVNLEIDMMIQEIRTELSWAMVQWPMPNPNLAKLTEETGEVAKYLVKERDTARLRAECIQAAAMAIRVAIEGDPAFPWSLRENRE